MKGINSTQENLQAAIDGEGYEFKQMYPGFLAEAEKEGNKPAVSSFQNALAVEEIHHGLYTEALESVKSGSDLPETKIFVCQVCGNTVRGQAPDACPVCGAVKHAQYGYRWFTLFSDHFRSPPNFVRGGQWGTGSGGRFWRNV
jgi:rubrerythrin